MLTTEDQIQQAIVQYYRNNYCLIHHSPRCMIFSIPNEGKPNMIYTGLYPGAADLYVHHMGQEMFVEVKTPTGTQSPNQKKFEQHCIQMDVPYYLVRSLEEFKQLILPDRKKF